MGQAMSLGSHRPPRLRGHRSGAGSLSLLRCARNDRRLLTATASLGAATGGRGSRPVPGCCTGTVTSSTTTTEPCLTLSPNLTLSSLTTPACEQGISIDALSLHRDQALLGLDAVAHLDQQLDHCHFIKVPNVGDRHIHHRHLSSPQFFKRTGG
jgi:hypothetical protein